MSPKMNTRKTREKVGHLLLGSAVLAWGEVSMKAWGALQYAIAFSGILGHVFWYEGIERKGVAKSLGYLYFMPVCAALFNDAFMREKIFYQQISDPPWSPTLPEGLKRKEGTNLLFGSLFK
jgi:hypothetical protein